MTNRTDNFNRADTTSAIGTPSDGGSAWTQQSGTWGISTNQGYESGAGSQTSAVLESSVANVDVQATINVAAADCGLIARAADDNNYLLLITSTVVGGFTIYKRVAGSFTNIASASFTVSNGDVCKFEVDSSNLLQGFQNGVSKVSVTDSAGSTNTKHGIRSNNVSTARFDDFSITALGAAAVTYPQLERFGHRGAFRGMLN